MKDIVTSINRESLVFYAVSGL